MTAKTISSSFPFKSKYVEIEGAKIHYIDEGLCLRTVKVYIGNQV